MQATNLERCRNVFKGSDTKLVFVKSRRSKHNNWEHHGRVLKVYKNSVSLLINDERKINIGFRNIKKIVFLYECS